MEGIVPGCLVRTPVPEEMAEVDRVDFSEDADEVCGPPPSLSGRLCSLNFVHKIASTAFYLHAARPPSVLPTQAVAATQDAASPQEEVPSVIPHPKCSPPGAKKCSVV